VQFLDEVVIHVASGDGGAGHVSFRREKFVPRGGPDGGDGGDGGSVIFEATDRRNTLVDYWRKRHWKAPHGDRGGKRQMYGANADDLVCEVPIGTILYDEETGERIADLDEAGARWVLPGGKGGLGNMHFASSTNRTPRQSTPGTPGVEMRLRMELKLLADVGLLGFPNAGKSTLLRKVSAARPKVADYPFTTLVPQLGMVQASEDTTLVLADIPGLIEGAADGAGLGHQFLKHVERCAGFLHLVSVETWEGTPRERYQAINDELRQYGAGLEHRPQVVALTKIDLVDDDEVRKWTRALSEETGGRVFPISSITGKGLSKVLHALSAMTVAVRAGELDAGPGEGAAEA